MSIYYIGRIANFNLCLYSWLFCLGHTSHLNTPLLLYSRLTVRLKNDKIRTFM